jgi:predicted DNA-binding transcriptional regulator AlpA
MVNTGKFKSYLSIPEAAMVWEGISMELLHGAAYVSPGVPMIVGHPDVTARAEALIEATDMGTLVECSRIDPDMRLPAPEHRKVSRQGLMEWIQKYWPEELPGKRKFTMHEQPPMRASEPADRFLTTKEVWEMLGIKKATFYRRRGDGPGDIPPPEQKSPNRWRLSTVQALMDSITPDQDTDADAVQDADEDEDI